MSDNDILHLREQLYALAAFVLAKTTPERDDEDCSEGDK